MTITTGRGTPLETGSAGTVALTGPSPRLDLRTAAMRGDIVDIGLAGSVSASRYVMPLTRACGLPRVPMHAEADARSVAVSELLFGERFDVFEVAGAWSWGRTAHDQYLGWVDTAALAQPGPPHTHGVVARHAPVFDAADIKSAVRCLLPFGARLTGAAAGRFVALAGGGFVHVRHVASAPAAVSPLHVARTFTAAPYVWGGRTPDGVDCSGLVQAALNACGIACPRDSDQQLAALGVAVAFDARAAGDIVFFPGHVGILAAPGRLFHANAFWMTTLEEPLDDVIARLVAAGVAQPVSGVRRLTSA